ncbi:hypothetical protein L6452_25400 [Arctium lappa]|uniref:Uncharacterized protein n=1 Tax=Arctium lappa TaxID=4217 RepID=A0ACB9AA87_ARCLA|nr:hypothetical protein L6452_25400 [Arctium lappa]
MHYCMDHPEEISKLAKVKAQVTEVKGVMMENIEKVLDRGEKIEIRVVNEPLESISYDLGFNGNSLVEGVLSFHFTKYSYATCIVTKTYELMCIANKGFVVSTCLVGAFIGSLLSGWIADGVGRRLITTYLCRHLGRTISKTKPLFKKSLSFTKILAQDTSSSSSLFLEP